MNRPAICVQETWRNNEHQFVFENSSKEKGWRRPDVDVMLDVTCYWCTCDYTQRLHIVPFCMLCTSFFFFRVQTVPSICMTFSVCDSCHRMFEQHGLIPAPQTFFRTKVTAAFWCIHKSNNCVRSRSAYFCSGAARITIRIRPKIHNCVFTINIRFQNLFLFDLTCSRLTTL